MRKNKSIEANLQAAKAAIHEMVHHWHLWEKARNQHTKTEAIAAYAAAFTSCKVYIENYLKQLHPNEMSLPGEIAQTVRKIVNDMDVIERTNGKKLERAIHDIDELRRKAA